MSPPRAHAPKPNYPYPGFSSSRPLHAPLPPSQQRRRHGKPPSRPDSSAHARNAHTSRPGLRRRACGSGPNRCVLVDIQAPCAPTKPPRPVQPPARSRPPSQPHARTSCLPACLPLPAVATRPAGAARALARACGSERQASLVTRPRAETIQQIQRRGPAVESRAAAALQIPDPQFPPTDPRSPIPEIPPPWPSTSSVPCAAPYTPPMCAQHRGIWFQEEKEEEEEAKPKAGGRRRKRRSSKSGIIASETSGNRRKRQKRVFRERERERENKRGEEERGGKAPPPSRQTARSLAQNRASSRSRLLDPWLWRPPMPPG